MSTQYDPKQISAEQHAAYNRLAKAYHAGRGRFDLSGVYADFKRRLPERGTLLDLGCGAGDSVSALFVRDGWRVVGYDFSEEMLKLAKVNNPAMRTFLCDLCDVRLPDGEFNAAIAVYSLFHLNVENQFRLLEKVFRALAPGGCFLFTYGYGAEDGPECVEEFTPFMSERLFYARVRPEILEKELDRIGFTSVKSEPLDIGGETFLWYQVGK